VTRAGWNRLAIRWHNHDGMDEDSDAEALTFDAARAESLIGKPVLVGAHAPRFTSAAR